jgi:hypothetical protein
MIAAGQLCLLLQASDLSVDVEELLGSTLFGDQLDILRRKI